MCNFSTAREQGKGTSAGAEHSRKSSGDLSLVLMGLGVGFAWGDHCSAQGNTTLPRRLAKDPIINTGQRNPAS